MNLSLLRSVVELVSKSSSRRRQFSNRPRAFRPAVEALEQRWVPAQFIVNMLQDAGAGTLRQAIIDLNNSADASNTIVFQGAATTGVINLSTALQNINKNVDIQGPNRNLTVRRSATATVDFSIFTINTGRIVTISGLVISHGRTTDGSAGGINNSGTLTVSNCTVTQNGSQGGGGITNYSSLTVNNNTTISDNFGFDGGGILNYGSLALDGVNIVHNEAVGDGGGIYNRSDGSVTMELTSVRDNVAGCTGGGIVNEGTMEVLQSTISNNGAADDGGGIYNDGLLTIKASTLSRNRARENGGGIRNRGTQTIENSTFNRNQAKKGGGLYNSGNSTQKNNTYNKNDVVDVPPGTDTGLGPSGAAEGGGIYVADGAFEVIINTIVAGNTINGLPGGSSPDVRGVVQSQGHNLIGDGTGSSGFSGGLGDLVGTSSSPIDPMLSELGYYGGPTETQVPLAGSPAIDAGDNSGSPGPYDQRGFARIVNGIIDIGAVEVQFSEVPLSSRRKR